MPLSCTVTRQPRRPVRSARRSRSSSRPSRPATRVFGEPTTTAPMRFTSTRPRRARVRSSTGHSPRVRRRIAGSSWPAGLTPENVVDGIERVRPWGVDVATGVEKSPGVKDPTKLKDFINAAKRREPRAVRRRSRTALRLARRRMTAPVSDHESAMSDPGGTGYFGRFGGRFLPEVLVACLRGTRGGVP